MARLGRLGIRALSASLLSLLVIGTVASPAFAADYTDPELDHEVTGPVRAHASTNRVSMLAQPFTPMTTAYLDSMAVRYASSEGAPLVAWIMEYPTGDSLNSSHTIA